MTFANLGRLQLPFADAESAAAQHDEEIHTVDTRARIVLDTEVDVLRDAETEVALEWEREGSQNEQIVSKRVRRWDRVWARAA